VLKDDKQAVYWYKKAADQGDAEAQSILGVMYANGKGVLKIPVHGLLIIF
jgi:TPR repeat protein